MAEKKEKEAPEFDFDAFVARKLKAINEMENKAKAKFLAQRVLESKRGKK